MYNAQRRGDSWKLNDLRALLFGHYARESKATSSPLVIEGFSRQSVKKKMQKMRKVLGDDVMNFATSSTDVDELNAIFSQHHPSLQDGTSSTPVLICMRHIDHVYITPLV